jgi:hypothetical protein
MVGYRGGVQVPRPKVNHMIRNLAPVLAVALHRFESLDVRPLVDEKGIDQFVEDAARSAAAAGAVAGVGGAPTFLVGFTADTVNLVFQHVRVAMAVVYARTGRYSRRPSELLPILALSLGRRLPGTLGVQALVSMVAAAMAARLGKRFLGKAVPLVGVAFGGVVNYRYIKGVAQVLQDAPLHELAPTAVDVDAIDRRPALTARRDPEPVTTAAG